MVTTLPPTSPARTAADRLIVALDFPDAAAALACADQLAGSVSWFKVGLELYLASGDSVVRELKRRGHSVFLDLKLHDIPNTAASAVRSLARLEPDLLTIHAAGGRAMLNAAAEAASSLPHPPRLLAVTVLTSVDAAALAETGVPAAPVEQVLRLARLAADCGINGMVCSPGEAAALRSALPEALLVTPGIRPAGTEAGDQKRIATPQFALAAGASMLVIGRPITAAANPKEAAKAILSDMSRGNPTR
ncbi:MAG TPA: orotidine-5'-phosphate decarboxylase [Acidobacteriaceae bacterium]|jgi:orotidine-5'-phosphate decarboxylase